MNEQSKYEVALATTPGPSRELTEAEAIAAAIEDAGVPAPPGLVLTLERLVHRLAFRLAGEALHRLSLRLPKKSAAGVALARVIRGPEGESLREAGRRCRVSHVAILKAEKRLEKALRLPPSPPLDGNAV